MRGLEHWELELLPNIGVEWVVANAGGEARGFLGLWPGLSCFFLPGYM